MEKVEKMEKSRISSGQLYHNTEHPIVHNDTNTSTTATTAISVESTGDLLN